MHEIYLKKLEYDKALSLLSKNAKTYIGMQYCLNLKPSTNKEKVQKLLNETLEACNLIIRKGSLPISDFSDISLSIKNLESNISLSAKSLLEIATIFKLSRELKDYFYKDEEFDISDFPILDDYFSKLYLNKNIEDKIFSSIIDENTISDDASTLLSTLRRNKRKLESQIKDNLNKIIHSNSKAIMDPIVTIRNDRYVIPVKEEFKGTIKGFIHDVSSSGSTIFIEPMSVFELNNSISNIKIEESIEIEKILSILSSMLFEHTIELSNNMFLLGKIDFIFAKATFAKEYNCNIPKINDNKFINLINARHPLIDKDKVVPINVSIGENYTSLIITGPNTGGKTVTLKIVGLLTLMACSGLHIPASENSSIYVFDNIFADIGDEQSIQESLSTFSSHIVNIINILNDFSSNSLILLDELGSGTDPVEGANLAISILEHFNKKGAITFATTHYPEIKKYALVTDGFENASSEFDIENLKPTYKLLIGIPGKSNAFAISKKLGLSENILSRAESLLNSNDITFEEILKNIYDDKTTIEKEKEEILKNSNQIQNIRKSLEKQVTSNKENQDIWANKSKEDAKKILLSTKDEANSILKELNNIYSNFKQLENLDLTLSDSEIANIVRNNFKNNTISKANKLSGNINKSLKNLTIDNVTSITPKIINIHDLKVGMNVKVKNISDIATIYSISNKSISLKIGSARMNVKIDDIISIENSNNTTSLISSNTSYSKTSSSMLKSKNAVTEINVIGQNIEEACFVIDKYLDDCIIAKLQTIRIVHGKGTGKLRDGIHTFLRKHPHVKGFRVGSFGEGEMGVTIVELK